MTIQEMKIGDHASVTKTVSETDVYLFAGITGDLNPAHTNEVAASKTMFKTRIAHGMLGAGFISAVLGMYLPGPGTIYMGQELKFTKPVHIGDTVTATATVLLPILPARCYFRYCNGSVRFSYGDRRFHLR